MNRLLPSILTVLLGLAFVFPTTPSWSAGTLKVTTPNGGQKWKTGKKYAIKWVKGNAGRTVKIQLLKSGKHHKWIAKKTKNDGKYTWKIPTTVDSGSAYKVKIVSIKNKRVFDKSNKNFTITQTDSGGTTRSSTGSTKNAAKSACTKIKPIKIGKKYRGVWTTKDCDSTDTWGNAKFYTFKIATTKTVTINLCSGIDPYLRLRKGRSTDGVIIESNDNSGTRTNSKIVRNLSAGTYTIEAANWGFLSTYTRVKFVLDTTGRNCNNTKLTVAAPNGGEKFKPGNNIHIRWEPGKYGSQVQMYLYKDGTKDSNRVLRILENFLGTGAANTNNDGTQIWKIPSTVETSARYKIKIVSGMQSDFSDRYFTITKTSGGSSSLSVTTPNGGQKWQTGKKYTIKWAKGNGGTKVKIQLLKSGKHNHWISKNTKNDGKHPWTIPATIKTGTAYKIKITSISKKTVTDTSNKNFTITKGGSSDDTGGGR